MRTLTVAEMRETDRCCIEDIGIPGAVLMNNAGQAVFETITKGPVGIVCGKGNNGGDGFVVARLCRMAGYETRVLLLCPKEEIQGDAALFLRIYERLGGEVTVLQASEVEERVAALQDCSLLVDAILGTGTTGEVRGAACSAIEAWPQVRTVAVDLPSGLDADTGEVCGVCIRADLTITFQYAKRGFENAGAAPYLGEVIVADIGIPACCVPESA